MFNGQLNDNEFMLFVRGDINFLMMLLWNYVLSCAIIATFCPSSSFCTAFTEKSKTVLVDFPVLFLFYLIGHTEMMKSTQKKRKKKIASGFIAL